jgi:hypothetical protein
MDEKIHAMLDRTPEKPPRSKLEPHAEVIRRLRRKGRTYQEIAQFFLEHLNIRVAPSTIHAFVRVRSRRHQQMLIELPAAGEGKEASLPPPQPAQTRNEIECRRRIEELKRGKPPAEPEKPRFEYNEDEELHLPPRTKSSRRTDTG